MDFPFFDSSIILTTGSSNHIEIATSSVSVPQFAQTQVSAAHGALQDMSSNNVLQYQGRQFVELQKILS